MTLRSRSRFSSAAGSATLLAPTASGPPQQTGDCLPSGRECGPGTTPEPKHDQPTSAGTRVFEGGGELGHLALPADKEIRSDRLRRRRLRCPKARSRARKMSLPASSPFVGLAAESATRRVRGRLSPVCGSGLRQDVAHVSYDGVLADHQRLRDLPIGLTTRDQSEDL